MDEMGTEEMWVIVRRGNWHSSPLYASVGVATSARSGTVSIGSVRVWEGKGERERNISGK